MKKFIFIISVLNIGISLQLKAIPYIGKGCTNPMYMDEDCDGYPRSGGRDGTAVTVFANRPMPPHMETDANDNDATLNTAQSAIARYGDFTNINDFKDYLRDLGYTHQINNIYFVSINGNDATGAPNDITRPYRRYPRPPGFSPTSIIVAGDVIVYRGGVYPEGLDTTGRQYWTPGPGTQQEGFQGTSAQPVIMINFPGERAIFKGFTVSGFHFTRLSRYVIVHGLEFDGEDTPGHYTREVVSFDQTPIDHVTLRNVEVRNGGRWGIFCYIMAGRDYVTLDHVSVHDIHDEHTLYHNDAGSGSQTDIGWVIKDCLFYFAGRHAIHWRGGDQFTFENNIFHSVGMMGIEIKNGSTNGIVRGNTFFNTERASVSLYDTDEVQHTNSGIDNILIANNTFIAKGNGSNGMGGDGSSYAAIMLTHDKTAWVPHRNIKIHNNVLYTNGFPVVSIEEGADVAQLTVTNNVFYRSSSGPDGMRTCGWTDGTHTSGPFNQTYCANAYYWNFNALMNPLTHPTWTNNQGANPQLIDVQASYTGSMTPWLFNPMPTASSPGINIGDPQFAPLVDIKGQAISGTPDAGSYEFVGGGGNQAPFVNAGSDQTVFVSNAVSLQGVVVDDGLPTPPGHVSILWSMQSGPGSVNFANLASANTTATFSQEGVYVLRLTANDGALFTSDQMQVTVNPDSGSSGGGPTGFNTRFRACYDLRNSNHVKSPPICYETEQDGRVELTIYSKDGAKIRSLIDEDQLAGANSVAWDRRNDKGDTVASGIYIVILKNGDKVKTSKVMVIK